MKLFVSCN